MVHLGGESSYALLGGAAVTCPVAARQQATSFGEGNQRCLVGTGGMPAVSGTRVEASVMAFASNFAMHP